MSSSQKTPRPAFRRKIFRLLEPRLQIRFTSLILSMALLMGGVLLMTIWSQSCQVMDLMRAAGMTKMDPLFLHIEDQLNALLLSSFIVIVVLSLAITGMAAVLTMRFVGPIYAMKRTLRDMAEGNFSGPKIVLRAGDEFKDVSTMINKVHEMLKSSSKPTE